MESIARKPKTFEERMDARRARSLAANRHRVFCCVQCGAQYGYSWVYEYGYRCDIQCDGELVEISSAEAQGVRR